MIKKNMVLTTLLAALPLCAFALFEGPIIVKNKAFVYKDNDAKRFMVRGVALSGVVEEFQTGVLKGGEADKAPGADDDLLSDQFYAYMERVVIPKLKELNVNVIRVYRVDPSKKHDKVMTLLKNEGIYVIMEVMSDKINVNRINPQYTNDIRKRALSVVDAFHQYENVLGFSVGNEVVFPGNIYGYVKDKNEALNIEKKDAAIEKSLMRDLKNHIKEKGYREIPIGVAMQDGPADSPEEKAAGMVGTMVVAQYYACETDGVKADFIGINSYRYVPPQPNQPENSNAYDGYLKDVSEFSIPVIFTEMGAQTRDNKNMPIVTRDWKIIEHEFKEPKLYNQFSGDVAFMFYETDEHLGLYTQQKDIDDPIQQTKYGEVTGGADKLKEVYGRIMKIFVPLPPEKGITPACPANFNPPLVGEKVKIQVVNYASVPGIVVVQSGEKLATLKEAPKGGNAPPQIVEVSTGVDIYIQQTPNNYAVCSVPGEDVKKGIIIKNNVSWANNKSCNY